jgi:uncharacterized protein (DUF736 family)
MQIGSFRQSGDEITGVIRTLTISAAASFVPVYGARGGLAPSHIVMIEGIEVGAAWPKSADTTLPLKVRIDDPSFASPVLAALLPGKDGEFVLFWKRPSWRG